MRQITAKQTITLTIGDILTRYPYNGTPQAVFNKEHATLIEEYEVRSVNNSSKIVELVTAGNDLMLIPMPGEVSRVFIHQQNLVSQQLWWVDEKGN